MINKIPRDWRTHGFFAQTELMAGILPRNGVHYLAGPQGHERDAVVADLATAIASDATVCGLSAPDRSGARASAAGFFGLPSGAATGVAILTSRERAETLDRAVQANALARGISKPLPVAVLGLIGTGADHLTGAHARVAELAKWFEADRGVALGLVVIDGLALPDGELSAFQRQGRAVLCVCDAAPAALDGVVLELGTGWLTVAKPAQGEPWAREFSLGVVSVAGEECRVLRPGKAVQPAPIWQAKPVAAVTPVAPEPQVKIVSRVAFLVVRGGVTPEQRAKFLADGFDKVVESADAALAGVGEIENGLREIVVAGDGDQRVEDLESRANQLRQRARADGVESSVTTRVAA